MEGENKENDNPNPELKEGEGSGSSWISSLPEDMRGEKSLATFKDVTGLAKSYVEAQKFIGGSVRIPGQDATEEDWNKFYAKLGRPESHDKYAADFYTEDLPEHLRWNEETQQSFLQMAYKSGLTPKQLQNVLDWQKTSINAKVEDVKRYGEETTEALKQEWGGAYQRNLAVALRAVEEIGGLEVKDILNKTGLGNHPGLVKMFAKIGKKFIEDKFISDEFVGVPTPADALSKAKELQGNPAYLNESHPDHTRIVDEVSRLYQAAYNTVG